VPGEAPVQFGLGAPVAIDDCQERLLGRAPGLKGAQPRPGVPFAEPDLDKKEPWSWMK
jgi:hypothetical protein